MRRHTEKIHTGDLGHKFHEDAMNIWSEMKEDLENLRAVIMEEVQGDE
jgi:hypothetical protein